MRALPVSELVSLTSSLRDPVLDSQLLGRTCDVQVLLPDAPCALGGEPVPAPWSPCARPSL